ncbi:phage protease [uncultured Methylophaga sp.]|uniref:phage protease n=1 Tax=uncultured Methylophaga sp. TaxID=285271 RepID=UPI00260307AE|nr:phage protease [uncultured Methylophaga sp.]
MHNIALAICSLLVGSDGAVQLFPAGQFDAPRGAMAGSGPWYLDDTAAAALIQRAQSRKNDIVFDYEHQTLQAAKNGQPAPAAGWGKPAALSWVPGKGLMLSNPQWTAKASEFIENKEYKYISPVFTYDPKTGRVLDLLHVALTNSPAIDGMDDLLAAASLLPQPNQEDASMNEELLKMLGLKKDASEDDAVAALKSAVSQVNDLLKALGVKDAQGLAALSSIGDQVKDLKKQADDAEEAIAAASITTPDSALKVINDLNGQVAVLTERLDGNDKDALIAAAKAEGKLSPAMESWAKEQPVDVLKSYFKSAPPIAALASKQTDTQKVDDDGNPVLSEGQLAVCTQMGIEPAEYAKSITGDS